MKIDSTRAYRPLWLCFQVMAPSFFGFRSQPFYFYTILMHFLITVMFPLHLLLGLLLQPEPAVIFKNLTISLTCVACSLKHFFHLWHLPKIVEIEEILKQLDECIQSLEEQEYYQETLQCSVNRITRCIYTSFGIIYLLFIPLTILLLFADPWELIYAAWFPFDWRRNRLLFGLAFAYQFLSIMIECIQGLSNDIFTPLTLCYLSGHLHLFGIRLSQLGFIKLPDVKIEEQLKACLQDYKLIIRLHQLTRETISFVQLTQLAFCGANLCIIVSYILFYVRDIGALIYNIFFFAVNCIQLFPSCYYASVLAEEAKRLPYSIFSGNWYDQSAQYRRNVLLFIQFTLRLESRPMMAGALFELNLDAFFATVKMAYSLFAVVVNVEDK